MRNPQGRGFRPGLPWGHPVSRRNSGLDPRTLGMHGLGDHHGTTVKILKGHKMLRILTEGKYHRFRQQFLALF